MNHILGLLTGCSVFQSPEILTGFFPNAPVLSFGVWPETHAMLTKGLWHSVMWDCWHQKMK